MLYEYNKLIQYATNLTHNDAIMSDLRSIADSVINTTYKFMIEPIICLPKLSERTFQRLILIGQLVNTRSATFKLNHFPHSH